MAKHPCPVIMLSAFTYEVAEKTIRALELGAVDFIQKPSGQLSKDLETIGKELLAKFKSVGRKRKRSIRRNKTIATLRPQLRKTEKETRGPEHEIVRPSTPAI